MKDFTKKASGEYEKKMGSSGKSPAFFESFTRVYLQLSTWTIEVQKNSWKILKTARFRCKLDGSWWILKIFRLFCMLDTVIEGFQGNKNMILHREFVLPRAVGLDHISHYHLPTDPRVLAIGTWTIQFLVKPCHAKHRQITNDQTIYLLHTRITRMPCPTVTCAPVGWVKSCDTVFGGLNMHRFFFVNGKFILENSWIHWKSILFKNGWYLERGTPMTMESSMRRDTLLVSSLAWSMCITIGMCLLVVWKKWLGDRYDLSNDLIYNDIYMIYTCIHACMPAYIRTYVRTYVRTYLHTYVHTDIQTYRHTDIQTYRHTDIHTYIQTYIHTYRHTYIQTYIHTYRHTYIHTDIHTYIQTYIHTYRQTYIHTDIHTYIQTYIHTYRHTYIQTYIHTDIHTYRHTYIQTYRHTYIQTDIHTYRHTYIHTDIHTYRHTYIHTDIHAYRHTYIHTDIHTYIQTYIQTYIHTDIHTYRHTYIQTYIHTYRHTYIHT